MSIGFVVAMYFSFLQKTIKKTSKKKNKNTSLNYILARLMEKL